MATAHAVQCHAGPYLDGDELGDVAYGGAAGAGVTEAGIVHATVLRHSWDTGSKQWNWKPLDQANSLYVGENLWYTYGQGNAHKTFRPTLKQRRVVDHRSVWDGAFQNLEQDPGDVLDLHGSFIEVHGLEGNVVAAFSNENGSNRLDVTKLNGQKGRAKYSGEGTYIVDTFQGDCVFVNGKNLREWIPQGRDRGGFDAAWPDPDLVSSMDNFTMLVAEALQSRAHCVIQAFNTNKEQIGMEDITEAGVDHSPWAQFQPQLRDLLMGIGTKSRMRWVKDALVEDESVESHSKTLHDLSGLLATLCDNSLGLTISPVPRLAMLRTSLHNVSQTGAHEPPDIETDNDLTEQLIQFIQHRRLCVMSFVSCQSRSTIQFRPRRQDSGLEGAAISVIAGQIVVFRHDLLSYSYVPAGPDLVLQAWLLQLPPELQIDHLEGTAEDLMAAVGATGRPLASSREVHIMVLTGYNPGTTFGYQQTRRYYAGLCDGFKEIPKQRWDMDLYYSPDIRDGLSVTKHTAIIDSDPFFSFDHEFFGYTYREAKTFPTSLVKSMEVAHDLLHLVGKSKRIRGERCYWAVGDMSRDVDQEIREKRVNGDSVLTFHYLVPSFLAYYYGTLGAGIVVDTACSSSMSAFGMIMQELKSVRDGRVHHKLTGLMDYYQGVLLGNGYGHHPGALVALSQARMTGTLGRSASFDTSANGFARGEAFGGLYFRCGVDDGADALEQLAAAVGSATNQDGRSASLTAPNGPSQSYCVRIAQRDINRHPYEVSITELHATGTALGDPIEVGSTRAMQVNSQSARPNGLLHNGGKSMCGHPEQSAGTSGLIKTVIAMSSATSAANCHFRVLNSNMDATGYPALFPSEVVDIAMDSIYAGVNSFGFGGTNARAELSGLCKSGHRMKPQLALQSSGLAAIVLKKRPDAFRYDSSSGVWPARNSQLNRGRSSHRIDLGKVQNVVIVCPMCQGPMCWLCKQAHSEEHRCTQMREDGADYSVCSNCYEGNYLVGGPSRGVGDASLGMYIWVRGVGSWSRWQQYEEMERIIDSLGDVMYVYRLHVGRGRQVKFLLSMDSDQSLYIYPDCDEAGQDAKILGPDKSGGIWNFWMINADDDGAVSGDQYEIRLRWNHKNHKQISWNICPKNTDGT